MNTMRQETERVQPSLDSVHLVFVYQIHHSKKGHLCSAYNIINLSKGSDQRKESHRVPLGLGQGPFLFPPIFLSLWRESIWHHGLESAFKADDSQFLSQDQFSALTFILIHPGG